MTVIHVITNMMGSGGAEVMLSQLVEARDEDRVLIVPLMDVADRHLHLKAKDSVDIRPLKVRSLPGAIRGTFTLSDLIRRERPDAIVCWLYHAMVIGQLAVQRSGLDVAVFWNVRQSLDDPRSLSASTRLALILSRSLSRRPAGIIFNSFRALDLHRKFGFRNNNCVVIPNGFDPAPQVIAIRSARNRLGIAGRLHPQKDHATFFAAASELRRSHPDVRFVAAGAGMSPDNSVVLGMMRAAGLPSEAVELKGNISDMSAFYRDIDGLVLSSRTEGFPNVVAEAMGHGRPAIATDVGDAALLIGNTGFVVPPGDPGALAAAMRAFLDLPADDYRRLSAAARTRVEDNYSIGRVAALYREFLGTGSSAAPSSRSSERTARA